LPLIQKITLAASSAARGAAMVAGWVAVGGVLMGPRLIKNYFKS
jgi:hypothetical protein